jgi:hypothetical protein
VEDRFTPLAGESVAQTEGSTRYVRSMTTPEGTRLAVYAYGTAGTSIGFRIRTNGQATMDVYGNLIALPNTRGQWRYVVVPVNIGDFLPLTITGNGTTVDIDHVNVQASTLLSPPAFKSGSGDMTFYTYAGATIPTTIDLSATDSNAADVVTYNMDNLPPDASFNTSTGAFSWKPTQAGTYTFTAEASDGTTVTTKRITIVVGADRQATVATVAAPFKPDTVYVSTTQAAYQSAYADMQSTIGSGSDNVYFQKLATLRTAVAGLQELNPLLKDGSLNYPNLLFKSNLATNFAFRRRGERPHEHDRLRAQFQGGSECVRARAPHQFPGTHRRRDHFRVQRQRELDTDHAGRDASDRRPADAERAGRPAQPALPLLQVHDIPPGLVV